MFFGLDLLLANFDQDRLGLPGRKRNLNLPGLFWLLLLDIAVEAVLLLVLLQSAFLLLGFPAYFCEFVGLGAVEAGVVEVALGVALAYLVEIIHVELGEGGSTWRTKEEQLLCLKYLGRTSWAKFSSWTTMKPIPEDAHRTIWLFWSSCIDPDPTCSKENVFFRKLDTARGFRFPSTVQTHPLIFFYDRKYKRTRKASTCRTQLARILPFCQSKRGTAGGVGRSGERGRRERSMRFLVRVGFGNKMYTGRSFDMQGFCGEMDESIPFAEDDLGMQSPIYASQLTAFKPHRTAGKYAYDIHETISLEEELNNSPTYKCPSCYGLQRQPTPCKQCGDSQLVGDVHPFAALLEQMLKKMVPALPVKEETSKKGWDWGSSRSIQEESQPGETAPNCKCCYSECQEFSYRVCDVCEDYAVCNDCWSKGKGSHMNHPLQIVLSHAQKVEQLARNNPLNMKKISEEFESEDASNCQEEMEMTCGACSQPIEDVYEACLSCEREGEQTHVCGECSELSGCPKKYGHELEMRTVKLSSKLTRLQSQQSNEGSPTMAQSGKFKGMSKVSLISIEHEDMDSSTDNLAIGKIFINGQELVEMEEEVFGDSYSPTTSYRISQHTTPEHNPRNPEESMVHIEMDCSIELHDTKNRLRPEDPKTPSHPKLLNPFTFTSAGTLLHEIPAEEEYVFNDYECDICKVQPMRGKRYHCTECENYDLCSVCYQTRAKKHWHSEFEEIDGGKLLQKREEGLRRMELRGSVRSIGSLRSMCELRHSAVK